MRLLPRRPLTLAAAGLLTVLTGCGALGAGPAGTSASPSDGRVQAPAGGQASGNPDRDAAFVKCLRDNGIDARLENGGVSFGGKAGAGGDDAVRKGFDACKKYAPPEVASGAVDQKMKDTMVAFAQCMRKNGVKMADPKFNADGTIQMDVPDTSDPASAKKVKDAEAACGQSGGTVVGTVPN